MSFQDIQTNAQPAPSQVGYVDRDGGGHHDTTSDNSIDGPPDYATIDPNELNRSVTPFPRPKSPTPSQRGGWPLTGSEADDDENRPDSSMSYTSSRPRYRTRRAKLQAQEFKHNLSSVANRTVLAPDRPNAKHDFNFAAPSSSSPSPSSLRRSQQKTSLNMLQIPALARLSPSNSEKTLQQVESSGSFSTLANNNYAGGQKKRGLVSQLSHGDWTTIGSFFSQSANSGSPEHGVVISQPYNFRHEGGIGSGSSAYLTRPKVGTPATIENEKNDKHVRTSTILMDIRTESRLGNRTSLPVNLPNAWSPIDTSMFDVGCGRNSTVRASVRNTGNRFPSPPSPVLTVRRAQSSAEKSVPRDVRNDKAAKIDGSAISKPRVVFWIMLALTHICFIMTAACITIIASNARSGNTLDGGAVITLIVSIFGSFIFGILLACLYAGRLSGRIVREFTGVHIETFFFKMSPQRVAYWGIMAFAEIMFLSTAAAITVITISSHKDEAVDSGMISWLIISIIALILSCLTFAIFYARRVSNRIVRNHRAEQRDEEWVEMHSRMHPNFSHPADQSKMARDIMKSVSQAVKDLDDPAHDQAGTVVVPNSRHLDQDPSQFQNPRSSIIGIARSDSLMRHPEPTSTPSMLSSTTATAETYESEGTEKPIISKRSSSPAPHIHSDHTTVLSAEEMSMVSMPKQSQQQSYIPHSLAMADLSSEANQAHSISPSVTASRTNSTIESLISSYVSEPGAPIGTNKPITRAYSSESMYRRGDALHSHPVLAPLRSIVTEAGTPDSQKSSDRIFSGIEGGASGMKTEWSIRDGLASRLATMTPIEERSEAGTRSSLLTGGGGRRVSRSQASDA